MAVPMDGMAMEAHRSGRENLFGQALTAATAYVTIKNRECWNFVNNYLFLETKKENCYGTERQ